MRRGLHFHRPVKSHWIAAFACWITAGLAACGDGGSSSPDSAVDADNGVCGTHSNPGVLKLTELLPATGTSVINQEIVHSFTVVGAPAYNVNFTFLYGPNHTAGASTPSDPKIQATMSGTNLTYRFTVESWSIAPGHVELRASGGYDTPKGCTWVFPSPLLSYDVTPVLDAGAAGEPKGGVDGGLPSPYDVPGALDVPATIDGASALDVATDIDVPMAFDGPATTEVSGALDSAATLRLDASLDL